MDVLLPYFPYFRWWVGLGMVRIGYVERMGSLFKETSDWILRFFHSFPTYDSITWGLGFRWWLVYRRDTGVSRIQWSFP